MGKVEIARYEQFLLVPQCFQNFLLLMRQNEYIWNKGFKSCFRFQWSLAILRMVNWCISGEEKCDTAETSDHRISRGVRNVFIERFYLHNCIIN